MHDRTFGIIPSATLPCSSSRSRPTTSVWEINESSSPKSS